MYYLSHTVNYHWVVYIYYTHEPLYGHCSNASSNAVRCAVALVAFARVRFQPSVSVALPRARARSLSVCLSV